MNEKVDFVEGYRPDQPQEKATLQISMEGKLLSGIPGHDPLATNYLLTGPDKSLRLIPGLIDIHVHGGKGITFGESLTRAEDDLREYSGWVASKGVTGFLCSIAAPDQDQLLKLVEAYTGILAGELPGAECLGLHLEGPFLSQAKRGAFKSEWLRAPTIPELESLLKAGQGWIRQVTIAPEVDGASEAAHFLKKAGVVVALGHTDCDYDLAAQALSNGFSHVTHTYNAMSAFSHFVPGAVGAVLTSRNATAELIADGIHVHPGAMKLLYLCLGAERVALITDAMAGAGMPDGVYELIGAPVIVKDRRATRPEDGRLAGSTVTLDQCVLNMVRLAGASFAHSVSMASLVPARVIHLEARLGTLEPGKDANFSVVDQDMRVFRTVVKGRIVFEHSMAAIS